MVRYPLGGMLSWVLQYLRGFQLLGHEVWFVEKAERANACYDPVRQAMTDDASRGFAIVRGLLARFGLADRLCFVDIHGRYHGIDRTAIEARFAEADAFLDMGTHGAWNEESARCPCRVWIDGEPGFTQMKMELYRRKGKDPAGYHWYYTTGQLIPARASDAPTAGREWRPIFHPVVVDDHAASEPRSDAPFTTVMNWRSYQPLAFDGRVYGHKDLEFAKFLELPSRVGHAMEIAVSGPATPRAELCESGWVVRSAHEITRSYDSFVSYARESIGEFSVCKNAYVALRTGWFSDRSAVYLASGRPVVLQDTGFSQALPCGEGLFAVDTIDDAVGAIDAILTDPRRHGRAAREIAREHLDAKLVLGRFLDEVGLSADRATSGRGRWCSSPLVDAAPDIAVRRGLAYLFGTPREAIEILEREPNDETSSFPSEIVTVRLAGAQPVRLFLKHDSARAYGHYGPREDIGYEVRVYRDLLQPIGVTVPRCHGLIEDPTSGHRCVVLEYVADAIPVSRDEPPAGIYAAAAWIGRFHRLTEDWLATRPLPFLQQTGLEDALAWAARVRDFARNVGFEEPWLGSLCESYERLVGVLFADRPVVVHGEYYPSNILARGARIDPIDWESACIGPGETDLAALTRFWPADVANRSEQVYVASRWPRGAPRNLAQRLRAARLFEAMRQVGSHPAHMRHKAQRFFNMLRATGRGLGVLFGESA